MPISPNNDYGVSNSHWNSVSVNCVFRCIYMANCCAISFLRNYATYTCLSLTLHYLLPHFQLIFYWENRDNQKICSTFFLHQISQTTCHCTCLPSCHNQWLPISPKLKAIPLENIQICPCNCLSPSSLVLPLYQVTPNRIGCYAKHSMLCFS